MLTAAVVLSLQASPATAQRTAKQVGPEVAVGSVTHADHAAIELQVIERSHGTVSDQRAGADADRAVAAPLAKDPLIPGKTRFGDFAPAAPADKTQMQAKAAQAGDRVSVLVHMQAGADRGPVRSFAAAQGGHVKYEDDILPNVVNLRGIPQGALNALAATPGVVRWEP
ncbi:MAG: hypothetical protein IID33_08865, partial [Planctomycetes bacterium]|nr:hypothetical protein [Planctomycetota bacterium]